MSYPYDEDYLYPYGRLNGVRLDLLGPAPLSQFDLRSQMRLQDPMDAYRPLNEQTSNTPYWDAFK